jgi:hypothetical protein
VTEIDSVRLGAEASIIFSRCGEIGLEGKYRPVPNEAFVVFHWRVRVE